MTDKPVPKQRLAVVITGEVVERAKNAVYFEPGFDLGLTHRGGVDRRPGQAGETQG